MDFKQLIALSKEKYVVFYVNENAELIKTTHSINKKGNLVLEYDGFGAMATQSSLDMGFGAGFAGGTGFGTAAAEFGNHDRFFEGVDYYDFLDKPKANKKDKKKGKKGKDKKTPEPLPPINYAQNFVTQIELTPKIYASGAWYGNCFHIEGEKAQDDVVINVYRHIPIMVSEGAK